MSRVGAADQGFSLVELLLVLFLLGMAGVIVLPFLDQTLAQRELRRTTLQLAALARDLRRQAVIHGVPQRLILNPSEKSYRLPGKDRVLLSQGLDFVGLEGGEPLGEGAVQFLFFPNGNTLGGSIGIAAGPGRFYSIRFEPLSGRILVKQGEEP